MNQAPLSKSYTKTLSLDGQLARHPFKVVFRDHIFLRILVMLESFNLSLKDSCFFEKIQFSVFL